jgi:cytochrome c oxidase assembly factor CtaG
MDWSDSCRRATGTSLETLVNTLNAFAAAVATLYSISFICASFLFWRWKLLEQNPRSQVWRYYGVFTAFVAAGSFCGCVAWVVRSRQRQLQ